MPIYPICLIQDEKNNNKNNNNNNNYNIKGVLVTLLIRNMKYDILHEDVDGAKLYPSSCHSP